MRTRMTIIAVVLMQLGVIAWMAGQREWILRRAPVITLRTAPVDPDDAMRGAYSSLSYMLNDVPKALCRDGICTWFQPTNSTNYRHYRNYRDEVVYGLLRETPEGTTELIALTDQKPTSGRFLRGRVSFVSGYSVHVRYGIEAYFSDKAHAMALDDARTTTKRGVPLDVHVAVSNSGLAVIRDVEWEPLGIVVRILREPRTVTRNETTQTVQAPVAIEVEIKNHGDRPLGVVARPRGRSFRLVSAADADQQEYHWIHEQDPLPAAASSEIRVLAPGESYVEKLSMNDPYWNVRYTPRDQKKSDAVTSLDKLEDQWAAAFRVEYVPELGSEALPSEPPVRPQPLLSARWWPNRGSD